MYSVYVLKSLSKGTRYVGCTHSIGKRIVEHELGLSRYTKNRGPWRLIYMEQYATLSEARMREKFLKSGKGREILDSLTS